MVFFAQSCFSRSVWSHEPWCQPCKLRYTVVSMSHIISAGTKGQHIRPLWPLLRLGSKIMLLRMGLLLRLGPNVITDGTFITLGSSYYTCAFNICKGILNKVYCGKRDFILTCTHSSRGSNGHTDNNYIDLIIIIIIIISIYIALFSYSFERFTMIRLT